MEHNGCILNISEASQYDLLTKNEFWEVFPRWPSIGFKTGSSQTTSCSIQSYFSDQWLRLLHINSIYNVHFSALISPRCKYKNLEKGKSNISLFLPFEHKFISSHCSKGNKQRDLAIRT